jgi:hypothetical protein
MTLEERSDLILAFAKVLYATIHRVDLEGQQRVDLTRSPRCLAMTAIAQSSRLRIRAVRRNRGRLDAFAAPFRYDRCLRTSAVHCSGMRAAAWPDRCLRYR